MIIIYGVIPNIHSIYRNPLNTFVLTQQNNCKHFIKNIYKICINNNDFNEYNLLIIINILCV